MISNNFLASLYKSKINGLGKNQSNFDGIHTVLDMIGVADPIGISDGINALIYLGQGDFKNAGISALGIVPYIGDTAKGARLGAKALKFADKADDVADAGKILRKSETVGNLNKFIKPKELRHIGVPGKNAGIREVVGTEIEARQLFNQQIEKATLKEVKPGVLVGKDINGVTYTFRAKSSKISDYVTTIDVNGIDGLRIIKFVEK